ncbi:hypothetical protein ACSS6W_000809 [Trichoderma asperelloides]
MTHPERKPSKQCGAINGVFVVLLVQGKEGSNEGKETLASRQEEKNYRKRRTETGNSDTARLAIKKGKMKKARETAPVPRVLR